MIGEFLQGMVTEAFDLSANNRSAAGNRAVLRGIYHMTALPAGSVNATGPRQKGPDFGGPLGP